MFGAADKTRLQRKSTIRFEKNLMGAIEKRDDLLQKQRLSVASGSGKVAILYSTARIHATVTDLDHVKQNQVFIDEAHGIREVYGGRDNAFVQIATGASMRDALTDKEVSDIVIIGHGTIGNLKIPNGKNFDWLDVSYNANHLKAGKIIQRVCGHFRPDGLSVPLGTFALSDITNLRAPVGVPIEDVNPDESLIDQQVYAFNSDLAAQIQELNMTFAPNKLQN